MATKFVDFKKLRNFKLLRRVFILLLLLGLSEGLRWANELKYINIPSNFYVFINLVTLILGSLIVVTLILRFTETRLFGFLEGEIEIEQRILLTKIYSTTLYILAAAFIFWRMEWGFGNITLFLGLLATGVAFAIRDVINSYFTWFIILTKKPFRIGDYVKIGDEAGTVERIGTFFITLQNPGAQDFIKVPNNTILTKAIINTGRNRIVHTLKFPLRQIPADIEQRLEKLNELVKAVVTDKGSHRAQLQTEGNGIAITISFPLPVGQVAKRTEFLAKAGVVVNDILLENRLNPPTSAP